MTSQNKSAVNKFFRSHLFKRISRIALRFGIFLFSIPFLIQIIFLLNATPKTFDLSEAPPKQIAIVFGAALSYNGTPSAALRDRLETAAKLYQNGQVQKLLMSGDNRFEDYNEPESMRQYALTLGIPDEDIVLDYAGRRTYDTCYRAKEIFQIESAILVTQKFHMPRALFLCDSFEIDSIGVTSDNYFHFPFTRARWAVRELFATTQSVWDVYIAKPIPVLGEPQPIFD